jgi:hypothetical protein
MFKRNNTKIISHAICNREIDNYNSKDFLYYDKDGFELNSAEQKFYKVMGYPIDYPILNHVCWQEPWFELESQIKDFILDHSMTLCRCEYIGEAKQQLEHLKTSIPQAEFLLRTRKKWGYDFALDAIREGELFEVLHIEYDHNDYDKFVVSMINFEWFVRHTDWSDAADRIWTSRDQWKNLTGYKQNDWKANYLLGWNQAEYTEKNI